MDDIAGMLDSFFVLQVGGNPQFFQMMRQVARSPSIVPAGFLFFKSNLKLLRLGVQNRTSEPMFFTLCLFSDEGFDHEIYIPGLIFFRYSTSENITVDLHMSARQNLRHFETVTPGH